MRVFTPGSMKNGDRPKYWSHIHSSVWWTGGTTFEMATPWMAAGRIPRVCRSVPMNNPYSSAVCSRRLVRRHETSRRCPSNTPIFVLVLPTSATSSMNLSPFSSAQSGRVGDGLVPGDLARNHAPDRAPGVDQERSVDVEVHSDAGDAVQRDVPAEGVAEHPPLLADGAEAFPLEARTPRVEFLEQRREHRLAVGRASGLQRDRGGMPRQLRRELTLSKVDADADYCHVCCSGVREAGLVCCSGVCCSGGP